MFDGKIEFIEKEQTELFNLGLRKYFEEKNTSVRFNNLLQNLPKRIQRLS